MKNIVNIVAIAALVALFVSCEELPGPIDPIFPEFQELGECEAGETFEFAFEANLPWKLVSDKPLWCKFDTPAGQTRDISGTAGKVTVTVVITDDGIGNDPGAPASLSLTMGGETKVVGEVSRKPLGYDLKVFDTDGREITVLEAGYGNYRNFYVVANFRFAAVDWNSSVFDLRGNSIYGNGGDRVAGGIMLKNNGAREKNPFSEDAGYTIIFSDKSGDHTFEFPVIYKGMGGEDISFAVPGEGVNWEVTADGDTFTQDDLSFDGSCSFSVFCKDDLYEVVAFSGEIFNDAPIAADWVKFSKNGGNVTLTVDENTEEAARSSEVWVFPAALYERLGGTVEDAYNAVNPPSGSEVEAYEEALRLRNKCFVMRILQAAAMPDDGIEKPIAMRTDLGLDPRSQELVTDRFLKVTRIYDEDILTEYEVDAAFTVTHITNFYLLPKIDGWTLDNFDSGDGSDEAEEWTEDYLARVDMYYKDRKLAAAGKDKEYEVFDITRDTGIPGVVGFSTVIFGPNDGWKDPSDPENWVYAVFTVSRKEGSTYEPVSSKLVIIKGPSSNNR